MKMASRAYFSLRRFHWPWSKRRRCAHVCFFFICTESFVNIAHFFFGGGGGGWRGHWAPSDLQKLKYQWQNCQQTLRCTDISSPRVRVYWRSIVTFLTEMQLCLRSFSSSSQYISRVLPCATRVAALRLDTLCNVLSRNVPCRTCECCWTLKIH